jgi:hypothetical protein
MQGAATKGTCLRCGTMLYGRVDDTASFEKDGQEHSVERCRDVCSNRMRQLDHGRGAGYCGYQWGMGGRNHGGGCEQAFADAEEVYRCLTCGGVFHKRCLQKHFENHSGATPQRERACVLAYLRANSAMSVESLIEAIERGDHTPQSPTT